MNQKSKIGFLGAGNMAGALMMGLSKQGCPASLLFAYDVDSSKLKKIRSRLKIKICESPHELLQKTNVIVLATKPQDLKSALRPLRKHFKKHLVISIAAGMDLATLSKFIPTSCKIIRAMPNNPALIGEGITALFSKKSLSSSERKNVENIFQGAGEFLWVKKENDLDAVTGLSGSGPAYVYQFIVALTQAGVKQGLSQEISHRLALKTVMGSTLTLVKTGKKPQELIPLVTSKKGTTLAGLAVMKKKKFDQTIIETVAAASRRAHEIKNELKNQ